MATLLLVRHAQASFFGPTYDRLTEHGRAQARALGRHWVAAGVRPHQVVIGPLVRHRETAELVGDEFASAGCSWPDAQVAKELDEHQGIAVVKSVTGFGSPHDDAIHEEPASTADRESIKREFFGKYREVLTDWALGRVSPAGMENWAEFRARAGRGLDRLTQPVADDHVTAAFTSGGFVSAGLGHLLELSDGKVVEISFVVRNCSVAEVRYSPRRRILVSFNVVPDSLGGDAATFV